MADDLSESALRYHRLPTTREDRGRPDQAAGDPARPLAGLFARRGRGLQRDRARSRHGRRTHRARQSGRRRDQRHGRAGPRRDRPAGRQAGDGGQGRPLQEVRRHRRLRPRTGRTRPGEAGRHRGRAGADLRRHQPRGHQGAGVLLRRAEAARAHEDPGVPRRPAWHRHHRRRRAAQRPVAGRQGHRQGEARRVGRRRGGAVVPRRAREARPAAREHVGHRHRRRGLEGPQRADGPVEGALRARHARPAPWAR